MRFWSAALGYKTKSAPEDDWVILVLENGGGAHLALGTSETPVQLHPRIHLDLHAEDQEAEIERLLELGAERVAWDLYPPGEEVDFVVLADPEGTVSASLTPTAVSSRVTGHRPGHQGRRRRPVL